MYTCFRHTRKDFPTNLFLSFFLSFPSPPSSLPDFRDLPDTILPSQLSTLFTRLPLTTSRCLTRVWIGNLFVKTLREQCRVMRSRWPRRERKRLIRRALIEWWGGEVIARGGKRARELQIECGRDNCSRDVTAFIKSTLPEFCSNPFPTTGPPRQARGFPSPSPIYPIVILNDKTNSPRLIVPPLLLFTLFRRQTFVFVTYPAISLVIVSHRPRNSCLLMQDLLRFYFSRDS